MTLIKTLNHFIEDQQGHLQCLEWDIREETNHEANDLDWLRYHCEEYDDTKKRLEDLEKIKSIIAKLEETK